MVCVREGGREGKVIWSWKHPPSPHTLTCLAQLPMESSHFGLYPHPKFSKLELSFKHHFEQPFWKECQQGGKICFLMLKTQSLTRSFEQGAESYKMTTQQRETCRKSITGLKGSKVTHSEWDTSRRHEVPPLHVWETVCVELNNGLPCAREFFLLFSRMLHRLFW